MKRQKWNWWCRDKGILIKSKTAARNASLWGDKSIERLFEEETQIKRIGEVIRVFRVT